MSSKVYILLNLFFALHLVAVHCVEFHVGGDAGWAVPSSKNDQLYNDWASKNRFKINDTLRFEYSKDSVLEVTQEEYEKCRSTHPMFFSNNGNSVYRLDHPGLYYFMSGVAGHCERGLKMIIKVLEPQSPPQVLLIVVEELAACFIQAAWRRYSRKKLEESLREEENRLQDALGKGGSSSPSLGATIFVSRFAANVLRALRRNKTKKSRMPERISLVLLQKLAEPDFIVEDE
ncbi:mavicyanin-like [Olea europaea subsp. europaea]|uniref:Mavicyanin-like n=1 Tax=Olea europaea subsp. europaea TaxID=158383 RepID=A0A8S0RXM6_OLEEU|nr:mavicyanin-like [Olea europaea subsp. europaea]